MDRPGAGSGGRAEAKPKVPRELLAEAAVWVTRLHGPDRSPEMERDFRAWQALSPEHREAFEKCTDAWVNVGKMKVSTAYEAVAARNAAGKVAGRQGARWWAAGAATAGAMAVALLIGRAWLQQGVYSTDVGEQRTVMLDDGSRMLLNTDTRVQVDFDARQRTVDVRAGEALFEVAKDRARPFVVRVAGSEVVAVGTAFSVRYGARVPSAPSELTVTLIEGLVNVRPAANGGLGTTAPAAAISMKAGDRLRLSQRTGGAPVSTPRVDRPNVDQVTAWKRSEAVFEDAALRDAVAEMNRYSRTKIVLVDGLSDSDLRVSGLFRTGDTVGFAHAAAHLLGLKVREEAERLELRKAQ